ncbi:MAG TPA: hypothetical protein VFU94_01425 [Conexibacter sp.]|nr:hypothetical protein [Conexibacter sp.]
MGNKVALALSLLAVSIIVSACGGTQSGLGTTSNATAGLPTGRAEHSDPRKGCSAQGINSTQLGTGACTESGVQYVVANYGGVVDLRTLGVAILGVSVAPADRGHGRTVAPRRDAFLRVTLQVQNRDKVPHRFEFGQTMLGVGGDDYTESIAVERQVHQESIAAVNGGVIGPGETLRGDVLFDITEADYAQIQRVGRFFIWNFGGRASLQIRSGQVGQIRLYAVERS